MAKNNDLASVLAFEKKLVPSGGYFYGTCWDNKKEAFPLALQEKSVRGTISNRLKGPIQNDLMKLNAAVEKANLQTVDTCALGTEQDTLKHHFTLKILGGVQYPSACNNANFKQSYEQAATNYIEREGFKELGCRYAHNIANARFLWRNRVGAEKIEVQVSVLNQGQEQQWTFDATQYSIRDFDQQDAAVKELGNKIAATLASKDGALLLNITTYALLGKAQEVYPSEELVLDKGKSKKSKILYHLNQHAAMHSQKIGNALRSIDTWYPAYQDPERSAGPQLESSHRFHCLADLEKELLMRYMINGERSFIIQAQGYTVPIIGQCGHDFNAVVLCGEDNKPYVQFVDSWKTFNVLPTITELNAHFPSSAEFYIRSYQRNN